MCLAMQASHKSTKKEIKKSTVLRYRFSEMYSYHLGAHKLLFVALVRPYRAYST